MKKIYETPEMGTVLISNADIMNTSDAFVENDVLIDVGNLWGTTEG